MKKIICLVLFAVMCSSWINAQTVEVDSFHYPRNSIKYNLSAPLLFGLDNIAFTYERVIKTHRSWSVSLGYRNLPKIVNPDSVLFVKEYKKRGGYSFLADYRFYLKSENKYSAPHGIYISPFISSFGSRFSTGISIFKEGDPVVDEFIVNTGLLTAGLGVKLGYQFMFGDHWQLDLELLGPSVSWYRLSMNLEGDVEFDEEYREYLELLAELVKDLVPGISDFLEKGKFDETGRFNTLSIGFQYSIKLGYAF